MSLHFELKSGPKKGEDEDKNKKPQLMKTSIFEGDFNDDEEEENFLIPKGAKLSKNIGKDTPTSTGPKSFGKHRNLGFAASNIHHVWNIENAKHHRLNRPQNQYLNDKMQEQARIEEEKAQEQLKQKDQNDNRKNELKQIKELIKQEKNKIRICLLCKRKFADIKHITAHEEKSEIHMAKLAKPNQ